MKNRKMREAAIFILAGVMMTGGAVNVFASDASQAESSSEADSDDVWDSYLYGSLYTNNQLTFGPAVLTMPDYSVLDGDEIGVEDKDYLVSSDGCNYFYTVSQFEIMKVSYENSNEEEMLASYDDNENFTNVTMQSFEKSYLGEYPTIQYSIKATDSSTGSEFYATEYIILKEEETSQSLRLIIESTTEEAYNSAVEIFDTIALNTTPVDYEAVGSFAGYGTITAK